MLTTETTGKKPAKPSKVFFPKDKMPLLFVELAKAGLPLPAEYVTRENFVGLLDSAAMTYLAAKGQNEDTSFFNSFMEGELGADSDGEVSEATNTPLFH